MKTNEQIIEEAVQARAEAQQKAKLDSLKRWESEKAQILKIFPDAIPDDEKRIFILAGEEFMGYGPWGDEGRYHGLCEVCDCPFFRWLLCSWKYV